MNKVKFLFLSLIVAVSAVSCSDDDDPEVVNEEEVITDVTLTVIDSANDTIVYTYTDPSYRSEDYTAPEVVLTSGETYTVLVDFYNNSDAEDPEVVTEEITEECDDHFLQYAFSEADVTLSRVSDDVIDSNGIQIGLKTSWTAGEASDGSVTVTLIHEATSKDTTDANGSHEGGSTDAEVSFDLKIQ